MSALRIIGAIFTFLILGVIMALVIVGHQEESKKTFLPMDAEITSVTLDQKTETQSRRTNWIEPSRRQRVNVIVNRENFTVSTASHTSTSQYKPIVCYKYTVGETEYENCADHPSGYQSLANAQNVVNRNKVGETIRIYYDEEDPAVNRFTKSAEFPWLIVIVLGILMLALPLIIIFAQAAPSGYSPYSRPGDVTVTVN